MDMKIRFRLWAHGSIRAVLGGLFVYAALFKMRSPQDFADTIAAYHLLPYPLINVVALGLPFFELCCGLFVLTGFFFRIGVLGILAMLTLFTLVIAIALSRGLSVHCGCFGTNSWLDSNPWLSLLRDMVLLFFSGIVYQHSTFNRKMRDTASDPRT